jgi:hypothetical protein
MFDNIYFLHIQKNAGRFFLDSFIYPFSNDINILNDPREMNYNVFKHGPHLGWPKNITERTYIVTSLRDPIKRAVSEYVYYIGSIVGSISNGEENKIMHLDKKYFIEFIEKNNFYHNYSSKHLLYDFYNEIEFFYKNEKLKERDSICKLEERMNRCNLVIKSEDISSIPSDKIMEKISKDLSVELRQSGQQSRNYKINSSEILYRSLNDNDKDRLSDFFDLDYKIYNSINFWKP